MDDLDGRQGSGEFRQYGSILPDTTNRRERGVAHFLKWHIGCAYTILGHLYNLNSANHSRREAQAGVFCRDEAERRP